MSTDTRHPQYDDATLQAGAGLEAAIARMEAVTNEELNKVYWDGQGAVNSFEANNRVRAHLIAAARGAGNKSDDSTALGSSVNSIKAAISQPAEIPWIEWHGGELGITPPKEGQP